MKKYGTLFSFDINGVWYSSDINGSIFEKNNSLIDTYLDSNFSRHFELAVAHSVYRRVSKNILFDEAKIMESKDGKQYAILIDNELYPITINVKIDIVDPIAFLKNQKQD